MKPNITNTKLFVAGVLATVVALGTGCNKFLDREPLSNITPNVFLKSEADLAAYTINAYSIFPVHSGWNGGLFISDNHTDNQATANYSDRWVPGEWRVPQSGGSWDFGTIRNLNYYLQTVVPRWKNNEITGNATNVQHYVGEGYFLRAYEYFNKLRSLGDFPILRNTLPDDSTVLIAASKRNPRNEVARFILSDLDSAIALLADNPPYGKLRISKMSAYLFKSRVALFEGSWLKYHQGTAHVPGGPGWPGATQNPSFNINLPSEIDFFMTQAMDAAAMVADNIALVDNTKDDGVYSADNPYFTMFTDFNMNGYSEVLFWKDYNSQKGILHHVNQYINNSGANTGLTKGMVSSFLMANGLPIYAAGSGYLGDDSTQRVKLNRDNRLQLFMKSPGDLRFNDGRGDKEGYPLIVTNAAENKYVTGYPVKKGFSYFRSESESGESGSQSGCLIFRAAEAYLNYIEASFIKSGSLDSKADGYWRAIRRRAGVDEDYNKTIAATIMSEEAKNDFGAYSAGQLVDATLYNIRRERRNEFVAEGFRYDDLRRWRSMDQLKVTPYIIEGFKLWGPMKDWFTGLIQPGGPATANVSSNSESMYLRPYRINLSPSNLVQDGYRWAFAHYLDPIAIQHFLITASTNGDANSSIIYQNPFWPTEANLGATQ